ncbi:MAG: hemolysin III family protein [Pseudomonadota bacterium]
MALAYRYAYPTRTRLEQGADALIHVIGAAWALWLIVTPPLSAETLRAVTLLALFLVSAAYHFTPIDLSREYLRRADHCMIFVTIAAVPTPVALAAGQIEWVVALWCMGLVGAWCKISIGQWDDVASQACFFALGTVSAGLIIMHNGLAPVIWGGTWICAGLVVFNVTRLPFHMALWHLCVIGCLAAVAA